MPAEFESFCESYVGEFIESLVGARSCVFGTCPEDPPDTYACCWRLPDVSYVRGCSEDLTPQECTAIGGRTLQPTRQCIERGDCDNSWERGACNTTNINGEPICMENVTKDECVRRLLWPYHSGSFVGVGSKCWGAGSCCRKTGWFGNPFATCVDNEGWDEEECARRASYDPPGDIIWAGKVACWFARCFSLGKCCSRSGTCRQESIGRCIADQGGFFMGLGVSCTSQASSDRCPGSCCLGCGRCVDYVPKELCERIGTWGGSRTRCANAECPEGPLLN